MVTLTQIFNLQVHLYSIFDQQASVIFNSASKPTGKGCLKKQFELPTPFIRLYDEEGNYTGIRHYTMGLNKAIQPLESTTCILPDREPLPDLNDEVTGYISEDEDDEYDILQCEQEDESENCLHGSNGTIDLPITHLSTS